jgi:uncharacterized protein (TIGR02391 family)
MARAQAADVADLNPDQGDEDTHQRLLDLAAAHFMEHGTFPKLPDLERQSAREDNPLNYDFRDPLPENLGQITAGTNPQEVTLTVTGLARTEVARLFLEDVVRLAQFEHEIWIGPGEPQVTSEQLRDKFGMTDGTIIRLGRVLFTEGYLHAGFAHDPDDPAVWSCNLDKSANELKNIATVDELVAMRARLYPPRFATHAPSGFSLPSTPFPAHTDTTAPNYPVLDLDHLHPAVRSAVAQTVLAGIPAKGVLDAAKAYTELLRQKTGLHVDGSKKKLDGTSLVERAFARFVTPPDRDSQSRFEGIRQIAIGMMRSYRNQSAHDLQQLDPHEASEAIATFSMLCRHADAATLVDEPEANPHNEEQ